MKKIVKTEPPKISVSHVVGVQALEVHNTYYDFKQTMQRVLKELSEIPNPPYILDISYSSDEQGLTITVYYT